MMAASQARGLKKKKKTSIVENQKTIASGRPEKIFSRASRNSNSSMTAPKLLPARLVYQLIGAVSPPKHV
jgi:hypothetical protein